MQLLKRVVLHGIPDYEATARGGCTPFLQVLPAPWQQFKPNLYYNSAWQRPKFETYMPDPSGTIVFEVCTRRIFRGVLGIFELTRCCCCHVG